MAGSIILCGVCCCFVSRVARILLVAGSFLALAQPSFAAAPADLSHTTSPAADIGGYWHIDGRLAGNAIRLLCHFDQSKPDFTGNCFGDGAPANGNVANGRVVWRWKVSGHLLKFDAMIGDNGALEGRVSTVAFAGIPVSGSFGAVRPDAEEMRQPPQGKSALKEILGDLARGRLPVESCTADFADGLRKQMPALQAAYQKLGAVRSINYVDTLHGSPRLSTEIYEVNFSGTQHICSIDLTKTGKLSELICTE